MWGINIMKFFLALSGFTCVRPFFFLSEQHGNNRIPTGAKLGTIRLSTRNSQLNSKKRIAQDEKVVSSVKDSTKDAARQESDTAKEISISPALARWAADLSQQRNISLQSPQMRRTDADDLSDLVDENYNEIFVPFVSKSKVNAKKTREVTKDSRRDRQQKRKVEESLQEEVKSSVMDSIKTLLSEKNFQVSTLLSLIRKLMELSNPSEFRSLIQGTVSRAYTVAWVGSDEVLVKIGTGLHKVPLARLQEIFLSVGPKKKWTLYEVIRILGPFPNVLNTLLGDVSDKVKVNSSRSRYPFVDFKVQYNSMIDGTGKEILAGKSENVRIVQVRILYADQNAIICTIPSSDSDHNDDVLDNDGKNVILFVREDDIESRLKSLRVSR